MSNTVAYFKTALMLSPLYHPATATGRVAGRVASTASRAFSSSSSSGNAASCTRLAPAATVSSFTTTSSTCSSSSPIFRQERRQFSSSSRQQLKLKEYFAKPENPNIVHAPPAWRHPIYSEEHMSSISVQHREAKTRSDKVALGLMRLLRWGLDRATFYAPEDKTVAVPDGKGGTKTVTKKSWFKMTERKWLTRLVFLESVAGVPGMVGGMLRHLHSLRRMKRDNGWIETLLEEAYNERMHLLTFLKLAEPGLFMRLMVLLTQGVFFNGFFLSYLVSPRTCHRFVGYLEEEAVYTYSRLIRDIEAGKLPQWTNPKFTIPDIAVNYWDMPEGKQTMRDLIYYVRADEAKHREVNHTLGNLDQHKDPNPYTSVYKPEDARPHPSKGLENHHPKGWEREEVM